MIKKKERIVDFKNDVLFKYTLRDDQDPVSCYEVTFVKHKLQFIINLLLNCHQWHVKAPNKQDLSTVNHSVIRGLITSG